MWIVSGIACSAFILYYILTNSCFSSYQKVTLRRLGLLCFCMVCAVLVYFGGRKGGESWSWAWVLSTRLARHIGYLELLLKLMFVNPPELPEQTTKALPVR